MVGALERHHPLLGARAELAADAGPAAGPGEAVPAPSHALTAHARRQGTITQVLRFRERGHAEGRGKRKCRSPRGTSQASSDDVRQGPTLSLSGAYGVSCRARAERVALRRNLDDSPPGHECPCGFPVPRTTCRREDSAGYVGAAGYSNCRIYVMPAVMSTRGRTSAPGVDGPAA